MTQTAQALIQALKTLNPTHMALDNESHMHAGYFEGKESHFKLIVVSDTFDGIRLALRHQKIYQLAHPFLTANGGSIHALSIHAYTPSEWANLQEIPNTPQCASKKTNNNSSLPKTR